MDPETLSERYNTDPVRKRLETLGLIYGADEIKETLAVGHKKNQRPWQALVFLEKGKDGSMKKHISIHLRREKGRR